MTQKSTPSIEAALKARIDALENRIETLERDGRPRVESVSKSSTLLRREAAEKKGRGESKAIPAAPAGQPAEGDEEELAGDQFEILSIDSRTFERNTEGDRCKFSWKIVVQSHAKRPILLRAKLEFVDMDSYLVEEDTASGFRLEPGAKGKFRGYKWISDEAEYQIVGVRAHLSEDVAHGAAAEFEDAPPEE